MFACRALESLFVFGPPDPDLAHFGEVASLELSQGRKLASTAGVSAGVEFLGLYQQAALTELRDLPSALRVLAIEGWARCRRCRPR